MVEFALVLPLLLLLIFGIFDFVQAQADSPELKNGGTNAVPNAVQVCVAQPSATAVGTPITATATFTYNWLPFLGLSATQTTVQASDTMRLENWNGSVVGCSS